MLVTQSCPTLCNLMNCSPPGSSAHGLLQARILEWVVIPSPGDLPGPGTDPRSPAAEWGTGIEMGCQRWQRYCALTLFYPLFGLAA